MDSKHPSSWWQDLAVLSVACIIFYFCFLSSYPVFTPDEARYSEIAREMLTQNNWVTPRLNGMIFFDKPIFHYWLQMFAMQLFGENEFAWRFFPALFSLITCLLTYITGRYVFSRGTGLLACGALATAPLFFAAGHYANLDLEIAALISCSLLCFLVAIIREQSIQKSWLYAAYTFAGLAILTKGLIGFVLPVMIVGCWVVVMQRWRLIGKMEIFFGIGLILLLALPWYLEVEQQNPGFWQYFFVDQQYNRFMSQDAFNNRSPLWFYLPIIGLGFMPWILYALPAFVRVFNRAWRSMHPASVFLVLWVVVITGFFSIPHSKIVTYILPIFPALALLAGHYAYQSWKHLTHRFHWPILVFYIVVTLCLIANLSFTSATIITPKLQAGLLKTAIVMILGCLTLIISRKRARIFILCCFAINISLLSLVVANIRYYNTDSAKHLVTVLDAKLTPQDVVINYYHYFYDVPLYLKKYVWVVANWTDPSIAEKDNWQRELWLSTQFLHNDSHLLSEKDFWKLWHGEKRVFVFVNKNYLSQFAAQALDYRFIAMQNDILLISNEVQKPIIEKSETKHPKLTDNKSKYRQYAQNKEQSDGIW